MVVDVRLENKGENAYSAQLNITYAPNLRFSSLIVKVRCSPSFSFNKWSPTSTKTQNIVLLQDTSDIKIECYTENNLRNERICNVSAPFMRAKSLVRRFQCQKGWTLMFAGFQVMEGFSSHCQFWCRRTYVIRTEQLGNSCKTWSSKPLNFNENRTMLINQMN